MANNVLVHTHLFPAYTIDGFKSFVRERENIRIKKENGILQPWTSDQILSTKSFCNIDRFYDSGTQKLINVLQNKTDDVKIIGSLTYRLFSSGNLILDCINESTNINEFILKFNKLDKFSTKGIPYQFPSCKKGVTFKIFFNEYIIKNKESILKCVNDFNNCDIQVAMRRVHENIGYCKFLKFGIFQFILDLNYFFKNLIDLHSKPLYGAGSLNCLKQMSRQLNLDKSYILDNLINDFLNDNKNEIILEHALCEYDKYSKYVLGIKDFANKNKNYKPTLK
jgi:hypothetical protein